MKLFTYFRSSAAYRVRIALNLKGVEYDPEFIHLRKAEQASPAYMEFNPQGLVPALVDGPEVLTQSLAIIDYLDETVPEPPFLPESPVARAKIRAIAHAMAADIHPINNLRVLKYLTATLGVSEAARDDWYRHWVGEGFTAIERLIAGLGTTGPYLGGTAPGLADICLVPQVYNAERFGVDMTAFPTIAKIAETCRALPAFKAAAPENQPDAE